MSGNLPGFPCWTQLATSDPQAAQRFYGGVFGWTAETDPDPAAGGYTVFSLDGRPAAASAPQDHDLPTSQTPFHLAALPAAKHQTGNPNQL